MSRTPSGGHIRVVGALAAVCAFAYSLAIRARPNEPPKGSTTIAPPPATDLRPPAPAVPAPSLQLNFARPFANATFEVNSTQGWTQHTGAPYAPIFRTGRRQLVKTSDLRFGSRAIYDAPLGGNYWNVPFPALIEIGEEGDYWLTLHLAQFGSLASPPLDAASWGYLSFWARAVPRGAAAHVELRDQANHVLQRASVGSLGTLSQLVIDLRNVPADRRQGLRLWFVSDGARDVDVDDFLLTRDAPQRRVLPNTAPPPRPDGVWGFADLHTHPYANLAYGGPYHQDGSLVFGDPDANPRVGLASCSHGPQGAPASFVTTALEDIGHAGTGYPGYQYWPRFNSILHQQLHVNWLRRAWQGGLRLIVFHAVNNMFLARYFGQEPQQRNDMVAARAQLDAMHTFVARHSDFMAIAVSPADARAIVQSGKLAVVLGIEIDDIGSCHARAGVYAEQGGLPSRTCDMTWLSSELDDLYRRDVRHIFPVHLADNKFGGTAFYSPIFHIFDLWVHGTGFQSKPLVAATADQRVFWHADLDWSSGLTGPLLANTGLVPSLCPGASTCPRTPISSVATVHALPDPLENPRNLQPLGHDFVKAAWNRGMLVDVDHMAEATMRDTVTMAKQRGVAVIAGHTSFRSAMLDPTQTDIVDKLPAENSKSESQVRLIDETHGVIGVGTGPVDGIRTSHVANDCGGSSRSFLQLYSYAVQKKSGVGVAIGTDMHMQGQLFPRFGVWACLGRNGNTMIASAWDKKRPPIAYDGRARDADAQDRAVSYGTPAWWYRSERFARPVGDGATSDCGLNDCTVSGLANLPPPAPYLANYQRYPTEAYGGRERAVWQGLFIAQAMKVRAKKAKIDPYTVDLNSAWNWWRWEDGARHLAAGFAQTAAQTRRDCTDLHPITNRPLGAGGEGCGLRRTAYLVKTGRTTPDPQDRQDVQASVGKYMPMVLRVWRAWQTLQNGGNRGQPLRRCEGDACAGTREFDYNLDGLAHYGLIPDMLQDVANQLSGPAAAGGAPATVTDLGALFHSAEDYIRAWESVWATRSRP